ncbi:uncharacterized protein NEMAJ01_0472 [Nematocida major]|uniref:uncharacterized protein n=1 Tax=Nematocida major TaxID=1912982 RepID=UPI00200810B4|nr:uncharacterized protein NEMAJ01_0472 [Nematocida major]KAH9385576.1 hypothetical protein NEMAJ01_0472 [Nematocida major]
MKWKELYNSKTLSCTSSKIRKTDPWVLVWRRHVEHEEAADKETESPQEPGYSPAFHICRYIKRNLLLHLAEGIFLAQENPSNNSFSTISGSDYLALLMQQIRREKPKGTSSFRELLTYFVLTSLLPITKKNPRAFNEKEIKLLEHNMCMLNKGLCSDSDIIHFVLIVSLQIYKIAAIYASPYPYHSTKIEANLNISFNDFLAVRWAAQMFNLLVCHNFPMDKTDMHLKLIMIALKNATVCFNSLGDCLEDY